MPQGSWQLRTTSLGLDRSRVMGILNVTPDSFYDRGRYGDRDAAVVRAGEMAAEGADIIDVGGEKAGPGEAVSEAEEIDRVCPVIERVRAETGLPVSVDTFKPSVARAGIESGAEIINSIGGFGDPAMREVAVRSGAGVVVMHIQGKPRVANPNPVYGDVVSEVTEWLRARARELEQAGVLRSSIVVDPGPGFGKTPAHDLEIVRNLDRVAALPYPVLMAASRKPFLGVDQDSGPEDRLEGSLAVAAWAVLKGARIVRTHDVKATSRVVRMVEAVLAGGQVEAAQ